MGVFDILPGLGGDGEAEEAEPSDDSGHSGGDAADSAQPADLTPADFRERAEALAGRSDVPTLDFTVDSLDPLDELVSGPPSAVDDEVAYGSYLGETIARAYGGEWVDEGGWQLAVELPDDRTTIAVFDAAEMSIAKEPVFAKVAARLEAEGAERIPLDERGSDEGDAEADSSPEPAGESVEDDVTAADDDEDEVADVGGLDTGAAAAVETEADAETGTDADTDIDDDAEPDTVVVDDPVVDADGEDTADVAADGVAADPVAVDEDGGATADEDGTDDSPADDGPGERSIGEADHAVTGDDDSDSDETDAVSEPAVSGNETDEPGSDDGSEDSVEIGADDPRTTANPVDDASAGDRGDVMPIYEEADDADADVKTDDSAVGAAEPTVDDADPADSPLDDGDGDGSVDDPGTPIAGDAAVDDESPVDAEAEPDAAADTLDDDGIDGSEATDDGDRADAGTADDDADAVDDPVAPERYVLRAAAEELADGWPSRDLDFTPESLPRLDAFVDDQWDGRFRASSLADRTVDHEDSGDPLAQLGAYYGEVLIRWLDGEWVATDDGEGAVAVPDVGEKVERVDVFALARECLIAPSTFAYRYDALVNRLYVDKPAVSDGRADVFDDDRDSLTSGDVITQFVATAEEFVEDWPEYPLDYTPRSVRGLDEIADRLSEDLELSGVPLADGTDPESLWLTARATAAGAYYAAVLLRHQDAQWRIGDDVELVVDRPAGERTVDPVATAADCLRGEGSFVETYASLRE